MLALEVIGVLGLTWFWFLGDLLFLILGGGGGLGEQGFSSGVFNFGCENFNFLQHPQITHCLKAINKYKLTHTCLGVLYELAHT